MFLFSSVFHRQDIFIGNFDRQGIYEHHSMARQPGRVQIGRAGQGRSVVGRTEKQAQHELRETVACLALLL